MVLQSRGGAVDFGLCFHILKSNCGPVREDNCYFNLPPCGAPVTPGRLGSDPANNNRTGCCSAGSPLHASPPRGGAYITHSPCRARSLHSATAHTRTCSPRLPTPTIGGQEWLDNNKSSFSGEAVPRLENCTYMPRTAPPRVSLPFLRKRTEHHRGVHPDRFQLVSSTCSQDTGGGDISRLSM